MTAAPARSPRGTPAAPPQPAVGPQLPAATDPAPGTDPAVGAGLTREWPLPFTVDVPLTLSVHRRGPRDPAYATDAAGGIWRTSLTPEGPGTLRVTVRRGPSSATGPPGASGPPNPVLAQKRRPIDILRRATLAQAKNPHQVAKPLREAIGEF